MRSGAFDRVVLALFFVAASTLKLAGMIVGKAQVATSVDMGGFGLLDGDAKGYVTASIIAIEAALAFMWLHKKFLRWAVIGTFTFVVLATTDLVMHQMDADAPTCNCLGVVQLNHEARAGLLSGVGLLTLLAATRVQRSQGAH